MILFTNRLSYLTAHIINFIALGCSLWSTLKISNFPILSYLLFKTKCRYFSNSLGYLLLMINILRKSYPVGWYPLYWRNLLSIFVAIPSLIVFLEYYNTYIPPSTALIFTHYKKYPLKLCKLFSILSISIFCPIFVIFVNACL